MSVIYLLLGIVLLYFGAEILVRGSSNIALNLGVRPIIVGLTVVAFGTSSPELIVSMTSALDGAAPLAVGNVIGSNICNIALIVGIAAVIRPIRVEKKTVMKDVVLMLGITGLIAFFILNSQERIIERWEGIVLFSMFTGYIAHTVIDSRKEIKLQKQKQREESEYKEIPTPQRKSPPLISIALILGGLVALVFGSDFFVKGATQIARYLHVSEAVIGLTLVAFGTSLPELATTIVAAVKNENDLAFGNAVGSNIFNVLLVLGLTSVFLPLSAAGISTIDIIIVLAISALVLPMAWHKFSLNRFEGFILLVLYIGYIIYRGTHG
jgi:cation:H+ antiporter